MDTGSPYQPPATLEPSAIQPVTKPAPLSLVEILFTFEGRIPRRQYWLWMIVSLACCLIPMILVIPLIDRGGVPEIMAYVVIIPAALLMIWTGLAIRVKRWHDQDKSWVWIFIGVIPYVGGLISFIFLGCVRGTEGDNRYGADPT